MTTAIPQGPPTAGTDRRRWWILAVLCLSVLLVVVDNTIVNVALPTISRRLSASTQDLQWIVDAYTLVFAGLLLVGGNLGDRIGRRRVLQAGLVLFALTSVGAALSRSTGELIAGRAAMGIAAALIYPATLAILSSTFTVARERATAIGIWSGVSGLAVAIGPVSGGVLLRHFAWSSVFYVNVPIVIIALAAGWRLLPESRDPKAGPVRPARRGAVHGRGRPAGLDGHRGAPARLGLGHHPRRVRRIPADPGPVRAVPAAPPRPPARRAAVPQPAIHRGQRRHRAGVLRPVRVHLPDHPVLPDRPGLRPAAGRPGHGAVRGGHRGASRRWPSWP